MRFVAMCTAGICVVAVLGFLGTGLVRAQSEEVHPLVGKPAPPISLDQLDGKKFTLADFKGKNIVVLDFWASWCPPCRAAMPILIEGAKAFKDKGVVFCGVNIGESPEAVKAFQTKMKLEFNVALDKDKNVANAYKAESIPQSVIVGKDGMIEAVHVGMLPDLKERLKKELDTLTSGKSLVKPEPKK